MKRSIMIGAAIAGIAAIGVATPALALTESHSQLAQHPAKAWLAGPDTTIVAKKISATYVVPNPRRGKARGKTITADLTAKNLVKEMLPFTTYNTVSKVVTKGVKGLYEMPYKSQGYDCTPTVTGKKAEFTCVAKGADNPMNSQIDFTVNYK